VKAWIKAAPLFFIAVLLFVVGLIGGTAIDEPMAKRDVKRGEYHLLEADFHAHTRFSDGFLSPFDIVLQARRRGLDVLAVTEHNLVFPGQIARAYSRTIPGGPTVLVGEEVTTNRYHLHGIGLTEKVDASQPVSKVIDDIHAQGGIAIAAHPVKRFWPTFDPVRDKLDGAEVMHPLVFSAQGRSGSGWRWGEMREFYTRAKTDGHDLMAIGSSDYHFFSPLGVCRTLVFAKGTDEAAVMEALRAKRTVVFDLDGTACGHPEMIELLRRDPYVPKTQDYDYRGTGWPDKVLRTVGFLGLLGLVLFAANRRKFRAPS
jgi:hypothetical protein